MYLKCAQMERVLNSDSETHVEKQNRTSKTDLSFKTLWDIFFGTPCRQCKLCEFLIILVRGFWWTNIGRNFWWTIPRGPTCKVHVPCLWHVVITRLKLLTINDCATQFNPIPQQFEVVPYTAFSSSLVITK